MNKLKKKKDEELDVEGLDKDLNYTFNTEADYSTPHFEDPIFESARKEPQIKKKN